MRSTTAHDLLGPDTAHYRSSASTAIANLSQGEAREVPGVITVITAEEIEASGARDLQEALTLVPGMNLGCDIDDRVAVSIRGNWAEEGKCLVMLNGVFLNEISYGTFTMGQRIPLGNVSRIEVISGPGSVVYGGFAALGVVNIITKDAREFEGMEAVVHAGSANGMNSRLNAQVHGSHMIDTKTEVSYSIYSGAGRTSTERVRLADGRELSYGDSTEFENQQFAFTLRTPRTQAQIFFNAHKSEVSEGPQVLFQRDLLVDLGHTLPIGDRLKLSLRGQYRNQLPWNYINSVDYLGMVDQRVGQTALLHYRARPWLNVTTGLNAYCEVSRYVDKEVIFSMSGGKELRARDIGVFSEATITRKWGSTTIGARAEKNTFSDLLFAPRFAWTKAWRRIHMKLLYSTAYRLPTFQNMEIGPPDHQLSNEWTFTTEAEAGWRSGRGTEVVMNVFRVDIRKPIVYVYEYASGTSATESYISRQRAGTYGAEIKLKHVMDRFLLTLSYGNYQVMRSVTELPEIELPAPYSLSYQSVPRHTMNAVAAWNAFGPLSFESRVRWQSAAWSYQYLSEAAEEMELFEHAATLVTDVGVRYEPKSFKGPTVRLGIRDLFAQGGTIPGPYATGLAPLPLNRRELTLELRYCIGR